uniref:Peptidase M12B domain-containing protein n=1 Tax=Amblyomma maculatum TaxID=34609 RepID=G3MQ18_AMBMU
MWMIGLVLLSIHNTKALEKPRLVYPRLLEERSSDGRLALHVHDGLILNLRKATVAAPEFRVLTNEKGRTVTHLYDGEVINKNLYEDEEKLAAVEVTRNEAGVTMRGLVGPHHRIQPLPVLERSQEAVVPHLIYDIDHDEMLDKTLRRVEKDETVLTERAFGISPPSTVYIEFFVVTSKPHQHRFPETNHLIWYACIMVNFANLRLAQVTAPNVKLRLIGLERNEDEPYTFLSRDGYLHDEETLKAFRSYAVKKKNHFGNPDIVFYLSGYDVFTILDGLPTAAGLGIAYLSGLCTNFYVGLGEDMPGLFTGAHTMTHEVAHLLGATHDGDGPDSEVRGHPSAVGCSWKLGHIMSYENNGHTHHLFSQCSVRQMRHVVTLRGETCWNYTGKSYFVKGTYPGMAVTFEEFCMGIIDKKRNFTYADVSVNTTTCKVRCIYKQYYRSRYYPYSLYESTYSKEKDALDYMPCGYHEVCIKGLCVRKPTEGTVTQSTTFTTPTVPTTEPTIYTDHTTSENTKCECDCSSATSTRPTAATWTRYPPRPVTPQRPKK